MNIDELQAGRELDALVAEKVMGWMDIDFEDHDDYGVPPDNRHIRDASPFEPVPRYSTDIAAAWQVVVEVQRCHPGWRFSLLGGDTTLPFTVPALPDKVLGGFFGWQASFYGHEDADQNVGQRHGEAFADTPELAVCLAALKAARP